MARGNSFVEAWGNSFVEAWENSFVKARENSSVVARGNSSVEAWENSSVEAWENSSVVARGNAQVVNRQFSNENIYTTGNARIVFMPKTIKEFMDFYNVKHDEKKAIFFKAVHHTKQGYVSDYDVNFRYFTGKSIHSKCDPDIMNDCSYGIHIAHLDWCLNYGRDWKDLAIIEVETDINNIILPVKTDGKMRTSEVKVLREVPLEECGVLGKILAKRNTYIEKKGE